MEDFTPRTIEPVEEHESAESSHADSNPEGSLANASLLSSYEIGEYFNTNMQDYRSSDRVDAITKQLGLMGFTGADALIYIQNIENRLSPPDVGVDRLNHFWNYFQLMLAANDINKKKQIYEQ